MSLLVNSLQLPDILSTRHGLINELTHSHVSIWVLLLGITAFGEALWLAVSPTPRPGLEQIWALPASFGACCFAFGKVFSYHRGGLGLKLFYFIMFVRYMLTPGLIVVSGGRINATRMCLLDSSSYEAALVIMLVELVVSLACIAVFYPRAYLSACVKAHAGLSPSELSESVSVSPVTPFGYMGCAVVAALLLARIGVWWPELEIPPFKMASGSTVITIDAIFFTVIVEYAFLLAVNEACRRRALGKPFGSMTLLALALACFAILAHFGEGRILVIEIAAAALFVLVRSFPKARRKFLLVAVPIALALSFSMFVTKQYDLEDAGDFDVSVLTLQGISNDIEEYTNGPWVVAVSYESSLNLSSEQSLQAFAKNLVDGTSRLAFIPGYSVLTGFAENYRSASDVMKSYFEVYDRGQMLSFSGDWFIVANDIGWVIFPVAVAFAVRLLIWFEVRSKTERGVFRMYIFTWMSVLFGIMFMYCSQTLLFCWSKNILFLWLIVAANDMIVRKSSSGRAGRVAYVK